MDGPNFPLIAKTVTASLKQNLQPRPPSAAQLLGGIFLGSGRVTPTSVAGPVISGALTFGFGPAAAMIADTFSDEVNKYHPPSAFDELGIAHTLENQGLIKELHQLRSEDIQIATAICTVLRDGCNRSWGKGTQYITSVISDKIKMVDILGTDSQPTGFFLGKGITDEERKSNCLFLEYQSDKQPGNPINLSQQLIPFPDYISQRVQQNDAFLSRKNLTKANLPGVHLIRPNLLGTVLDGANLTNAQLVDVDLLTTKIDNDTDLTNASISLINFLTAPNCFSYSVERRLDIWLNHLNHPMFGSLLTSIDRINNKFNTLKINLMHQIIGFVEAHDVSIVREAFLNIFIKNPIYLQDQKIVAFIKNKLLNTKIAHANLSALYHHGEAELGLYLDIICALDQTEQQKFMLGNNSFFIQLMMQCTLPNRGESSIARAQKLYAAYLAITELAAANKHLDLMGADTSLIDKNSVDAGPCFVFFKKDDTNNCHFLLLSGKQIWAMTKNDIHNDAGWDQIYYAIGDKSINNASITLEELFSKFFPLFEPYYLHQLNHAIFPKLLSQIDLNYQNSTGQVGPQPFDYTGLFLKALTLGKMNEKLVTQEDQERLQAIFEKRYVGSSVQQDNARLKTPRVLSDQHFTDISTTYNLSQKTPTTQAQTLFCLAAVFTNYSSAYFFGTEKDSPVALRVYAAALLRKAYELDPTIFTSAQFSAQQNYDAWMSEMLGVGDAFPCTAILSGKLTGHARQQMEFRTILNGIKPLAW